MKLRDFYKIVVTTRQNNPHWRKGQTVFNIAHAMHSGIANKYRGSKIDPFYNNSNIKEFSTAFLRESEEVSTVYFITSCYGYKGGELGAARVLRREQMSLGCFDELLYFDVMVSNQATKEQIYDLVCDNIKAIYNQTYANTEYTVYRAYSFNKINNELKELSASDLCNLLDKDLIFTEWLKLTQNG